jgi:hypothetical protein
MAMAKKSAKAVGDSLEAALHTLEKAILAESPSLANSTFQFEPNKIIIVDGVRHEIDLRVTVDHGNGYTATFIFECKNWKKKIGKSHIIEFSEKVKVAPAQKGFFVAKSFTRYAKAQAARDPRIKLLNVEELDVAELPSSIQALLNSVHYLALGDAKVHIRPHITGISDSECSLDEKIEFLVDNVSRSWDDYVNTLMEAAIKSACDKFDSFNAPDGGAFPLEFDANYTFKNQTCSLNGYPLDCVRVYGTIQAHIARLSVIESQFEVAGRGRVYSAVSRSPIIGLRGRVPQTAAFIALEKIHRDAGSQNGWTVTNPIRSLVWFVGSKKGTMEMQIKRE